MERSATNRDPDDAGFPHEAVLDDQGSDLHAGTDLSTTVVDRNKGGDFELMLGPLGRQLRKHGLAFAPVSWTRPRRNIYIAGEASEYTYMVCEGWACRVVRLSDGRRQILSILLPGDLFSATAPFQRSLDFHVEAITNVRCAAIGSRDLRTAMAEDPLLLDSFMDRCIAETIEMNQRLVDLGQRLAEEKIALLMVRLMERLAARGMVSGHAFEFPLRQSQIADATGLTPVHVSRILGLLRKSGLIELRQGILSIPDLARLRRTAGLR